MAGTWVAAGYRPVTLEGERLVSRTVFVLGAASVTLAAAAVATQIVDGHGALLAPALPVTSLTRNVACGLVAILGLPVILNGPGLSIAPMLATLGGDGLAAALALQEPLVYDMLTGDHYPWAERNHVRLDPVAGEPAHIFRDERGG